MGGEPGWRQHAWALPSILWVLSGCRGPEPREPPPAGVLIFEGQKNVSEKTLRKAVQDDIQRLYQKGFQKAELEDLAFEVERFYRTRGYHFASARAEHSPGRGVIRVEEGPRVVIRELLFLGNSSFSDEELQALLDAPRTGLLRQGKKVFIQSQLEGLTAKIEEAYLERGFSEVKIAGPRIRFTPDHRGALVSYQITEGPRFVLRSIELVELPLLDRKALQERLKPLLGLGFVPRLASEIRIAVEEFYANDGYPDAKAQVSLTTSRPPRSQVVDVVASVSARPGPRVHIGRVIVQGGKESRKGFIRSRVLLEPGDPYDARLVRRSFRRLYSTGLFKSVEIRLSPAQGNGEERDLLVEVVEGSSLEYFFEVGLGSYELLRGLAGVRERDLLGRGIIGRAQVEGSIRGAKATVGFTDPWFLRTEWVADLPLSILHREEPSFTVDRVEAGLKLTRKLGERLEWGVAYRFNLSRLEKVDVLDPFGQGEDLFLGALGPFLQYDTRDDLFEPTRGFRSRAFAELAAPFLGGEISFHHEGFTTSHYLKLADTSVLAGHLETEWIVPYDGSQFIPIQERLFTGGENSVRSFKQSEVGPKDARGKPLGGEVRNVASVELRQRLAGQLWGALFGDYGNIAPTAGHPFEDFRPAVGVGLRYGLPIGPLRVDLAFNPDRREEEDLFVVQFAVGLPY